MARDRFNKYLWILSQIYESERITFEEINRRWLISPLNDSGRDLSKRTFINHRKEIESIFDITISCDSRDGHKYYIEDRDTLDKDHLKSWMLSTFSLSSILLDAKSLNNRIISERIPKGNNFLILIIEAMKENKCLMMEYKSFYKEASNKVAIEPYFIKSYKQRWYLVAKFMDDEAKPLRIYAFDRIIALEKLNDVFEMDTKITAKEYFKDSFGIEVNEDDYGVDDIKIKVYNNHYKSDYFRTLPLHHTQRETKKCKEYSIFEYHLQPSIDFMQEIFSHGAEVEILSPDYLREHAKDELSKALERYKKDKSNDIG